MRIRQQGRWSRLLLLLAGMVLVFVPLTGWTASLRDLAAELLPALDQPNPPGEVLFAEDFSTGNLDGWKADAGWTIVDRPEGGGKCAQVVSAEDHEDLVLEKQLPVAPGHPIAVCWKARFVAGGDPLYLRVDFFDADGVTGKPSAHQTTSPQGGAWTDNALLVSDWFPDYTRAITIHFHHAPNVNTTSLLSDIRVVDLAPAVAAAVKAATQRYVDTARGLKAAAAKLTKTPAAKSWRQLVTDRADGLVRELTGASKLCSARVS